MQLTPDAPAIVHDHLAAESALTDVVGQRITDQTPDDTRQPWVSVAQLAAPDDPRAPFDYLVAYMFQLDCYAGAGESQGQANLLARIVRACLNEMPHSAHTGAVVTSVHTNDMTYMPDTDFEPARDRYVLTVTIVAHPS